MLALKCQHELGVRHMTTKPHMTVSESFLKGKLSSWHASPKEKVADEPLVLLAANNLVPKALVQGERRPVEIKHLRDKCCHDAVRTCPVRGDAVVILIFSKDRYPQS